MDVFSRGLVPLGLIHSSLLAGLATCLSGLPAGGVDPARSPGRRLRPSHIRSWRHAEPGRMESRRQTLNSPTGAVRGPFLPSVPFFKGSSCAVQPARPMETLVQPRPLVLEDPRATTAFELSLRQSLGPAGVAGFHRPTWMTCRSTRRPSDVTDGLRATPLVCWPSLLRKEGQCITPRLRSQHSFEKKLRWPGRESEERRPGAIPERSRAR